MNLSQKVSSPMWQKLLTRWSPLLESGEKQLLIAVIVQAIQDMRHSYKAETEVGDKTGFWGRSLENICAPLMLNPQFVRDQVLRASRYEPPKKIKANLTAEVILRARHGGAYTKAISARQRSART